MIYSLAYINQIILGLYNMDKENTPSESIQFTSDMLLNTHPDRFEDIMLSDGKTVYLEKVDNSSFNKEDDRYLFTKDTLISITSYNLRSIWEINSKDEELIEKIIETAEVIKQEAIENDSDDMEFDRYIEHNEYSISVEYLPYLNEGILTELESRE
jgi:hypothetical protein